MSDPQSSRWSAAPLVDRSNGEPAILRGLTSTESVWAISLAFLVWLFPGAVIVYATESATAGLLVCAICPIATVWLGAGKLQTLKRDRPAHYHVHLARLWLTRYLGRRQHFVDHRGPWDLGRSLPRK